MSLYLEITYIDKDEIEKFIASKEQVIEPDKKEEGSKKSYAPRAELRLLSRIEEQAKSEHSTNNKQNDNSEKIKIGVIKKIINSKKNDSVITEEFNIAIIYEDRNNLGFYGLYNLFDFKLCFREHNTSGISDLRLLFRVADDEFILKLIKHFPGLASNRTFGRENDQYGPCTLFQSLALEDKAKVIADLTRKFIGSYEQLERQINDCGSNGLHPLHLAILEQQEDTTYGLANSPFCNITDALELAYDFYPKGASILLATGKFSFEPNDPNHPLRAAFARYDKNDLLMFYVLPYYTPDIWDRDFLYECFKKNQEHALFLKENEQEKAQEKIHQRVLSLQAAIRKIGELQQGQTALHNNHLTSLCKQQISDSVPLAEFMLDIAAYYLELGAYLGNFYDRKSLFDELPSNTEAENKFKNGLMALSNFEILDELFNYITKYNIRSSDDIANLNAIGKLVYSNSIEEKSRLDDALEKLLQGNSTQELIDKLSTLKNLQGWLLQNKQTVKKKFLSESIKHPLLEPLNTAIRQIEQRSNFPIPSSTEFDFKTSSIVLKISLKTYIETLKNTGAFDKHTTPDMLIAWFKENIKTSKTSSMRGEKDCLIHIRIDNEVTFEKALTNLSKLGVLNYQIIASLKAQYYSTNIHQNINYRKILFKYSTRTKPDQNEWNWDDVLKLVREDKTLIDRPYNSRGFTLAHIAGMENNASALNALLLQGARIDLPDEFGNFPIHIILSRNSMAALKAYLIQNPTTELWHEKNHEDKTAFDYERKHEGKTAFDIALNNYETGNPEALELYIKYTGHIPEDFIQIIHELEKTKKPLFRDYIKHANDLITNMLDDKQTMKFKKETQIQPYINNILTNLALQKTNDQAALETQKFLMKLFIHSGATLNFQRDKLSNQLLRLFQNPCYELSLYLIKLAKSNSYDRIHFSTVFNFFNHDALYSSRDLITRLTNLFSDIRKANFESKTEEERLSKRLKLIISYMNKHQNDPGLAKIHIQDLFYYSGMGSYTEDVNVNCKKSADETIVQLDLTLLKDTITIDQLISVTFEDYKNKAIDIKYKSGHLHPHKYHIVIEIKNSSNNVEHEKKIIEIFQKLFTHGFINETQQSNLLAILGIENTATHNVITNYGKMNL